MNDRNRSSGLMCYLEMKVIKLGSLTNPDAWNDGQT